MLKITELLTPTPGPLWRLVRQAGVEEVVSLLDGGEQMWRWPTGRGLAGMGAGALPSSRRPGSGRGSSRRCGG